jgi:hypothetical protein
MDNIVSFKEFRNARKRPFEVAWRCDTNLIEHKTTLVATSKDDAESVFKSLFPAKNIRINHVVEDPTIKIYWVQMQNERKQKCKGKFYARSEAQVKEVCAYRFPSLFLEYIEENEMGGIE